MATIRLDRESENQVIELNTKQLNIKILTTEAFPIGLAATNRIMTYAKGFAEQNFKVSVYCIKPSERINQVFNQSSSGIINGVHYYYSGGKTILASTFIRRRIDNLKGMIKICLKLLNEKKNDRTDVIIYYSPSTSRALLFLLITRIKHILFLKEESEFPSIYMRRMNFFQRVLFKNLHYSLFDGSLIMTQRLINYFVDEKKRKSPYLHVPMTVDYDRFSQIEKENSDFQYIAYCGVLNNEKDGVDILIKSFAQIAGEFPSIKLYLIGDAENEIIKNQYINLVNQYNISERIIFTGRVDKDQIPKLLVNAKVLVLPRPLSLQSEGGFPTKLGEYLATGNPVVVTKVGEIPNYLTDLENAFMAEPGSVDSFASKMHEVLADYPKAMIIGQKGRETVMKNFNYKIQTKSILNFIKSFRKCAD